MSMKDVACKVSFAQDHSASCTTTQMKSCMLQRRSCQRAVGMVHKAPLKTPNRRMLLPWLGISPLEVLGRREGLSRQWSAPFGRPLRAPDRPQTALGQSIGWPRHSSQSPTENSKSPDVAPMARDLSFTGVGARRGASQAVECPIWSTPARPGSAPNHPRAVHSLAAAWFTKPH